jgi:serine/threonine-protein kinase
MNSMTALVDKSSESNLAKSTDDLFDDPALTTLSKWQKDELIIGGVLLKRKLGEGGMGRVYLGHHLRLNIPVAVKILKETSPTDLEMFLREARLTASIDHPNLVRIFDVNTEPLSGLYHIVMEYIEGATAFAILAASLREHGSPLDQVDAIKMVLPVSRALGEAHKQGVVHCDVKPDNILIRCRDGVTKLTDLGLAGCLRQTCDDQRLHTTINGTPGYISPEVLIGENAGPESDVYAIGATLYELVTGKLPFGATNDVKYEFRQLHNFPEDPYNLVPSLNRGVVKLILKCLSFCPSDRFANGEQLAVALHGASIELTGKRESTKREVFRYDEVVEGTEPVVLCVDDDPNILEFVGDFLLEHGIRAACFSDPFEALANLPRISPDAAILDLQMPRMDGLELFHRIRNTKGFEDLHALIFSASDNSNLIYKALKQGISDYLIKPVALSELLVRVKLLCRLRTIHRELASIESNLKTAKRIRLNESGYHGAIE